MNDSSKPKPKKKSSCQNPTISSTNLNQQSDIATSAWIDSNKNEQLFVA